MRATRWYNRDFLSPREVENGSSLSLQQPKNVPVCNSLVRGSCVTHHLSLMDFLRWWSREIFSISSSSDSEYLAYFVKLTNKKDRGIFLCQCLTLSGQMSHCSSSDTVFSVFMCSEVSLFVG